MKKVISILLTVAMLSTVFAMGVSAALPTYLKGEAETIFTIDFTDAKLDVVEKAEVPEILGGFSEISGSQRSVVATETENGKVLNFKGFYFERENGSVQKSKSSFAGAGSVLDCAKYTFEFDLKANYASAGFAVIIPWGDNTKEPVAIMFSPELFTDVDLQPHSTNKALAAVPEEALASDKWYHVTVEANNEILSAMKSYNVSTVVSAIKTSVTDLSDGSVIVPQIVTDFASPYTDSVYVNQAAAKIMTLCGNAHIGFGLYSCSGILNAIADESGSEKEMCFADYYMDNITLKKTPKDAPYETVGVIYENKNGGTIGSSGIGSTLNFPGGAIGKNTETNIGDGYDLKKMVATFDAITDADMFQLELYGMNVKNSEKWGNYVNNEDTGQFQLYKIPVEESARGKMYSYKVVTATPVPTVYRAEVGSDEYVLISGVSAKGTLSNMESSCARFLMLAGQGTTTGSYVSFENMVVVKRGAMSLTNNSEGAFTVAFDTGVHETAVPFAAFFDAEGNLIEAKHGELQTLNTGEGSAVFFKPDSCASMKIFLWDSFTGLVPIAEDVFVID